MKQLVVISGKGGTGKTSVVSSFAALARDAVLVDADVDAPNLGLVLDGEMIKEEPFSGGLVAVQDVDLCVHCGTCRKLCRFDAIDEGCWIDSRACEGCGLCSLLCPADAIQMAPRPTGRELLHLTPHGVLVSANLPAGEENSGKLVARVVERGRRIAKRELVPLIIVDGPPGIGCPVIASLSGADRVLLVAEPGVAGSHDLLRALDLAEQMGLPADVVINKWDLHPKDADDIISRCSKRGVDVVGRIPYDREVVNAIVAGCPPVTYSDGPASRAIREIWVQVYRNLLRASETSTSAHVEERIYERPEVGRLS